MPIIGEKYQFSSPADYGWKCKLLSWTPCTSFLHIHSYSKETNVQFELPSEISIPNLPNRWRQNMNSVWTDHYQRPLLTVCLYPRGAEGQSKLQQRPLITNLPLCIKFGTKLIGIWILYHSLSLPKWQNLGTIVLL